MVFIDTLVQNHFLLFGAKNAIIWAKSFFWFYLYPKKLQVRIVPLL